MANTIKILGDRIRAIIAGNSTLSGLTSTSDVADWRLWTDVAATAQHDTELLFDDHTAEVGELIATLKPHTPLWYKGKAKLFQFGDSLPDESDVYTVIDPAKQIVANAAVEELTGILRIKVAKANAGVLGKLTNTELSAFTEYMGRVKDAGVRLNCTSGNPDDLQLGLTVYYDPLVLDATGARLDGTSPTPVKDAINAFLSSLPFNGLFVTNFLIDAIQSVDGVRISVADDISARYGVLSFAAIVVEYTPDAGYLLLDDTYFDAHVNYIPHGVI